MKILILEDNQERIEFFKRVYRNHELYIYSEIFDAENTIQFEEIDIFLLDHDLEPYNLEALDSGRTGYDFVRFLVYNELQKKSVFYIHSCNPVGANLMLNLLKDNNYIAEWVPFYLMKETER